MNECAEVVVAINHQTDVLDLALTLIFFALAALIAIDFVRAAFK